MKIITHFLCCRLIQVIPFPKNIILIFSKKKKREKKLWFQKLYSSFEHFAIKSFETCEIRTCTGKGMDVRNIGRTREALRLEKTKIRGYRRRLDGFRSHDHVFGRIPSVSIAILDNRFASIRLTRNHLRRLVSFRPLLRVTAFYTFLLTVR